MLILVDDYDESDLNNEPEDDENTETDAAQFCRLMNETGGWNP
mgnify:CR=1 FL=1